MQPTKDQTTSFSALNEAACYEEDETLADGRMVVKSPDHGARIAIHRNGQMETLRTGSNHPITNCGGGS